MGTVELRSTLIKINNSRNILVCLKQKTQIDMIKVYIINKINTGGGNEKKE